MIQEERMRGRKMAVLALLHLEESLSMSLPRASSYRNQSSGRHLTVSENHVYLSHPDLTNAAAVLKPSDGSSSWRRDSATRLFLPWQCSIVNNLPLHRLLPVGKRPKPVEQRINSFKHWRKFHRKAKFCSLSTAI
eukprot:TRINITY_DN2209_c0_g1_i3.p1 TRINITY_DN2209_c0_g1~~TRINITY_DN2209_c0_g1_i3.p1  ORF type:complete len:135 (-),score=10.23 TRINITY_DN2209_c0_g1_i3:309-713(-)